MTRRKRTQFWGTHPDDDRLVHEILAGHKTFELMATHFELVVTP